MHIVFIKFVKNANIRSIGKDVLVLISEKMSKTLDFSS